MLSFLNNISIRHWDFQYCLVRGLLDYFWCIEVGSRVLKKAENATLSVLFSNINRNEELGGAYAWD